MSFRLFIILMTLIVATIITSATIAAAQMIGASTPDFIKTASQANQFEIMSSRLALTKSQNPDVRQFAQQMVDDHTKAGDNLLSAAEHAGADPTLITTTLDPVNQKLLDELKDASDNSFDRKYIEDQTAAHQQAVELFHNYSLKADDGPVKQFATDTLPVLQGHLDHVQKLPH